MNKLYNYIILSLFTFFLLITNCYALDYDFNSYHIDVIVNENNRLDITETIEANFYTAKHGIYRTIPYYNNVIREDGTSEKNRVKIYNIDVNNDFKTERKSGYLNIQIGSTDKVVTGLNKYIIKYSYDLGNDKNDNYDELYFNLIGTEWNCKINNVSFTITLPKEFDATKLGFTHGKYGNNYTDGITYTIKDNVIEGTYNNQLNINEGLTIRLELPEGYFIKDNILNHILELLIYIIPLGLAIWAYLIWNKYGKDDTVIDVVEFYPPEGLNSLDIAYIKKGSVNSKDVVSLLIYLANKGYLKIDDTKNKKDKFTISKLKEYDGNNDEEKKFLVGLFKNKDTVTNKDLEEKFYKTINSIIMKKNNIKNKNLIFDNKASKKRFNLYFMFLTCMLFSVVIPAIGYREYSLIFYLLPIYFIGSLATCLISSLIYDNNNKKSNVIISLIICFIGLLITSSYGIAIIGYDIIFRDIVYLIGFIISTFSSLIVYLFYIIVTKRTEYGTKMLGRINGFKTFLETAEKEKLELLVEENPMYFYDILPYTYVLGISNKWIKKFEDITIEPPTWYETTNNFEINRIINLHRVINTVNRSLTSIPQSNSTGTSSGGGFSGGGFSGGGSGGGGGGAW